jgi:hypothetical protein
MSGKEDEELRKAQGNNEAMSGRDVDTIRGGNSLFYFQIEVQGFQ